jgi:hypothetical protein
MVSGSIECGEYFIHFSREPVFQNVFDNLRLAVLGDYGGFALEQLKCVWDRR